MEIITILAAVGLAVIYGIEQVMKGRLLLVEKFEPYEIGDLDVKVGDKVQCTETYGSFTEGRTYVVGEAFGGALVVFNDKEKPVLAGGLDPRKFHITERSIGAEGATKDGH